MNNAMKLGITLMIVCAVAGAGLAAVYAMTKPVIERREVEDVLRAAQAAIPGAETVQEMTDDKGNKFWVGKAGDEIVGGAIKVAASGFGQSPIELMVGVDREGKVTSVEILSISETPGIGTRVKDRSFLARFLGKNDVSGVDGVSGATVSSSAVKGGVSRALEVLGPVVAPSKEEPIDLAKIPDGTYEGQGDGLFGPVNVSVTVTGGRIVSVQVKSHSDTPEIASNAIKGVTQAIVAQQKVDVDAVSGATFTSKGIIRAVKNALSAASQGK